jgi:hypothetical protein
MKAEQERELETVIGILNSLVNTMEQ